MNYAVRAIGHGKYHVGFKCTFAGIALLFWCGSSLMAATLCVNPAGKRGLGR